jgi:hypothetical protein
MGKLREFAPEGEISAYDQRNLLIYAELLDAEASELSWETGVVAILGFVVPFDREVAQRCWDTHLARARWIVGEGFAGAIDAFGPRSKR